MIKKKKIHILALILASALAFTHMQADASTINKAKNTKQKAEEDLNAANKKIEELERQQSALQSEIDEKDAELFNLLVNIGILEDELNDKNAQLEQVTADLAQAEETEKSQYASMKKRIQFMYERGDTAMIEALLGSVDMSDFLNRVEYVSDIYEYDRNLLTQYQTTVQQVAELKSTVETEKAELEAMQEEYALQQSSLENVLAQKRSQMGNYDNQLATAQAAANEFKSTIAAQNQIIKEEERKQKEAEAAAKAAAKANSSKGNTGNTGGGSDTGSGGSSGSGSSDSGSGGTDTSGGGSNPGYSTNVSGSSVVSYACQFVGNPYVPGGTSLTDGADCSGFTQAVYRVYGYSLPRNSSSQRSAGREVSYEEAQPGDLICYAGHVAIYLGNGRIVHASSVRTGIKYGNATYKTILSVRRIVN